MPAPHNRVVPGAMMEPTIRLERTACSQSEGGEDEDSTRSSSLRQELEHGEALDIVALEDIVSKIW